MWSDYSMSTVGVISMHTVSKLVVLSRPMCQLACLSVLQGEHIVVMHGAHKADQVGMHLWRWAMSLQLAT